MTLSNRSVVLLEEILNLGNIRSSQSLDLCRTNTVVYYISSIHILSTKQECTNIISYIISCNYTIMLYCCLRKTSRPISCRWRTLATRCGAACCITGNVLQTKGTRSVINLRPNWVNNACDGRRFRVIASYLSKVVNFNLPHLHFAPPLGVIVTV